MTHAPEIWTESEISVEGEMVKIHDLAFAHAASAECLADRLDIEGPESVANLLRRALSIGLTIAFTTESPHRLDPHSVNACLDGFADRVGNRAGEAVRLLDAALQRASDNEKALADTARLVLTGLPQQVEAALAESIGSLVDRIEAGASFDRVAAAARVDAALRSLGQLDEIRTKAHHAKTILDDLLTAGQDAKEGLRVNLIEALELVRSA